MKFIDGLCDDIKSIILVQRPSNLDTACALALLPEEADSSKRHNGRSSDGPWNGHTQPKRGNSLNSTDLSQCSDNSTKNPRLHKIASVSPNRFRK
jgi:hypothetical protein